MSFARPEQPGRPKSAEIHTPAFALRRVSFGYGVDRLALNDITLAIGTGEKVAILGANGCGKSTLIKILDGLIHPAVGEIEVFGEPLTAARLCSESFAYSFRRRVAFIFQNADAQLFSPTVREDIAFGPLHMGLSHREVESRVRDVAAMLGLGQLLDRPPFQLSGGEKKKVAIAGALAMNPDVLLLDEPTNGLDPRSQRWLVELLVDLHRAGKTLICATHDLDIVHEIADRALILDEEHRIAADGPSGAVLADRDLLLRVNLIHAHTHRHGAVIHVHEHHHSAEHEHDHGNDG